jgi:hypothetical protein
MLASLDATAAREGSTRRGEIGGHDSTRRVGSAGSSRSDHPHREGIVENKGKGPLGFTATRLLHSLHVQPFCDHGDVGDLPPEQQAALHAFMFELLASYWRMRMVVPEKQALRVLNARFAKAAKDKGKGGPDH